MGPIPPLFSLFIYLLQPLPLERKRPASKILKHGNVTIINIVTQKRGPFIFSNKEKNLEPTKQDKETRIKQLEELESRYCSDLVSLADRMETFSDDKHGRAYREISADYKTTAEAFIETKAELNILKGKPLTPQQLKAARRLGLIKK
jgi:hypothetical protein